MDLFISKSYRGGGGGDKDIFHLLLCFPDGSNGYVWARLKPEATGLHLGLPLGGQGTRILLLFPDRWQAAALEVRTRTPKRGFRVAGAVLPTKLKCLALITLFHFIFIICLRFILFWTILC